MEHRHRQPSSKSRPAHASFPFDAVSILLVFSRSRVRRETNKLRHSNCPGKNSRGHRTIRKIPQNLEFWNTLVDSFGGFHKLVSAAFLFSPTFCFAFNRERRPAEFRSEFSDNLTTTTNRFCHIIITNLISLLFPSLFLDVASGT